MSAPAKLQVNWEAHLEALPLATWIIRYDNDLSQDKTVSARNPCGPVFVNRACREALGFSAMPDDPSAWTRYLHHDDRQAYLMAWFDFVEGRRARFHRIVRWIRPDTKETVSLAVRAQKLLCGDIQGWLRSAAAEAALSRLEELTYGRR